MSKGFKIPSRNKQKLPEEIFICTCPYCGKIFNLDNLNQYEYEYYLNEIIIHCCYDFIPNKTKNIEYHYSGHCKRKDGK